MVRIGPGNAGFKAPPVIAVVAIVAALYLAREVLIPIALSALLTFLLAPLVRRLETLRVPRVGAVFAVVSIVALGIATLGWVLQDQAADIVRHLPQYRTNIVEKLEDLRRAASTSLGGAGRLLSDLEDEPSRAPNPASPPASLTPSLNGAAPVPVRIVDNGMTPFVYAQMFVGPLFRPLVTAGVVFVLTIFMLMKREDLRNRFIRLIGQQSIHVTTQALDDAAQRVNRYLVMQLIANTGAGIAVGTGLYLIGMPSALLWGLLIVPFRFIPFIGMWVAAAMPLALSVAQSTGWTQPLLALGLFATVELVTANVVEPLLLGTRTGISSMAVLLSAVFWGWLWGGLGLILATPMTVCVVVLGRHVRSLAFLDILLGSDAVLAPETQLYQRLLAGDADEATRIVDKFAKANSPADVYDKLLVPTLALAESDRQSGDLDGNRERYIANTMGDIVDDLLGDGRADGAGDQPDGPALIATQPVLCLPIWDQADELAGRMFAQLLRSSGVPAENLSAQAFSGELLSTVTQRKPSIVCLSAVPPGANVAARSLSKRLRAKMPDLHIVIGYWVPEMDAVTATQNLGLTASDRVVTNMSEGLNTVKALLIATGKPAATVEDSLHASQRNATRATTLAQTDSTPPMAEHDLRRLKGFTQHRR